MAARIKRRSASLVDLSDLTLSPSHGAARVIRWLYNDVDDILFDNPTSLLQVPQRLIAGRRARAKVFFK